MDSQHFGFTLFGQFVDSADSLFRFLSAPNSLVVSILRSSFRLIIGLTAFLTVLQLVERILARDAGHGTRSSALGTGLSACALCGRAGGQRAALFP